MSATTRINTHDLTQRKKIEAALGNEQLTRQRVTELERIMKDQIKGALGQASRIGLLESFRARGFFGRLRWLFLGK